MAAVDPVSHRIGASAAWTAKAQSALLAQGLDDKDFLFTV